MLSLARKNPDKFKTDQFLADFESLPEHKRGPAAANLAKRARNAEIERDGMADMMITIGSDAVAVATAAIITGRTKAKRDKMIAEWLAPGGGKDQAGSEEETPFFKDGEKNPMGIAGIAPLRWAFIVPAVTAIGAIWDWQGQHYARDAAFASTLYVAGDMLAELIYDRRLAALDKEGEEETA